jgi:hypothetical protein
MSSELALILSFSLMFDRVRIRRFRAQMKSSGDLASGETFTDQFKHLKFAIAKLLDRRTLRRSLPENLVRAAWFWRTGLGQPKTFRRRS